METQSEAAPRQQFELIRNIHNSKFDFGICVHRSWGNRFHQMSPSLSLSASFIPGILFRCPSGHNFCEFRWGNCWKWIRLSDLLSLSN